MNEITDLMQNLVDAGCTKQQIQQFQKCAENCSCQMQLRLLRKYRVILLNELHESQTKLDCLDFLMYKLEKEDHYL